MNLRRMLSIVVIVVVSCISNLVRLDIVASKYI